MFSRSLLMHIALLWTVGVVIVSFLPVEAKEAIGSETRSSIPAVRHQAAIRHRNGHLIAFGVASLLFATASADKSHRLYYFLMIAALGSLIEWLQHTIFGSAFEWWDVQDDTLAAAVGCLLGSWLASRVSLAEETSSR